MRHMLLSVGLAVCPALSVTQQPTPANLSLADAIALARAHNPVYRQAIHDRSPAGWGVRNAYASLLIPSLIATAGVGYSGPGQQRFLTSNFSQSVSTLSSFYSLDLNWQLSGQTLSQPGLRKAQLDAADADVRGAETNLITGVTQQYLSVLQARDNADVARRELDRNDEFLKLAQARYAVGRSSLIDVRQAQVARGQAEVALLRAQTALQLEKLRLFQQIGVTPPVEVSTVQLTDTFQVQTPTWQLSDLLTMAEEQNPSLKALRAREGAATGPGGVGAGARPAGAHRREPGLSHGHDRLPHHRDPGHQPRGGARAAAARHRALPRGLRYVLRAAGRAGRTAPGGERLRERRLRLSQGGRRARGCGGPAAAVTRGSDRHVQAQ